MQCLSTYSDIFKFLSTEFCSFPCKSLILKTILQYFILFEHRMGIEQVKTLQRLLLSQKFSHFSWINVLSIVISHWLTFRVLKQLTLTSFASFLIFFFLWRSGYSEMFIPTYQNQNFLFITLPYLYPLPYLYHGLYIFRLPPWCLRTLSLG